MNNNQQCWLTELDICSYQLKAGKFSLNAHI